MEDTNEVPTKCNSQPPEKAGAQRKASTAKHKKKKSPSAPTRPLSAYNFFFREERQRWLAERKGGPGKEKSRELFSLMGKEIARRWKLLKPEDAARYKKMAEEDIQRHRRERQLYNAAEKRKVQVEGEQTAQAWFDGRLIPQLQSIPPNFPTVLSSTEIPEVGRGAALSVRQVLAGSAASSTQPSVASPLGAVHALGDVHSRDVHRLTSAALLHAQLEQYRHHHASMMPNQVADASIPSGLVSTGSNSIDNYFRARNEDPSFALFLQNQRGQAPNLHQHSETRSTVGNAQREIILNDILHHQQAARLASVRFPSSESDNLGLPNSILAGGRGLAAAAAANSASDANQNSYLAAPFRLIPSTSDVSNPFPLQLVARNLTNGYGGSLTDSQIISSLLEPRQEPRQQTPWSLELQRLIEYEQLIRQQQRR